MAPPSPDLTLLNSGLRLLSFLTLADQQQQQQDMEEMEIDTVPDTPDSFYRQQTSRGGNVIEDIDSGSLNFLDRGNRERDRIKLNTGNTYHRRLFSAPRGQADTGFNREFQQNGHPVVDLADSPSPSTNARWKGKSFSRNVSSQEQLTEDVGPRDDRAKLDGGTLSIAELLADEDKKQGKVKGKRSPLISRSKMPSKSLCPGDKSPRKNNLHPGNPISSVDDSSNSNAGVCSDHPKKAPLLSYSRQNKEPSMSRSPEQTTSHRKNGKRLVRNGCISPNNIAKAASTAEIYGKGCGSGKREDFDNEVSQFESMPSHIQVNSHLSGGRHGDRVKGKGVMEDCSTQKFDNEISNLSSRSSLNRTEEATMNENASQVDIESLVENSGWRSTHNRSNSTSSSSSSLSTGARHLSNTNDRLGHCHEVSDSVSLRCGPTPFSTQASSGLRSKLNRESGRQSGTSTIPSRQKKRGSTCSSSGGCSTSVDDSEVAFLWASEEAPNARATGIRSSRRRGNLHPIIEIEDASPLLLPNTTQMSNEESEARARQLEADERLARELQEQLYHETPGVGLGEVDASIAWSLQHEVEADHASSLRRQRVNSRDASVSHLYRQHQTQALQNSINRASRVGRGRTSNSGRVTRFRERIMNSPRTLSSTDRNIRFHPNMDVDMRIHILEQLEAALGANDRAIPSSLFQLDRDFNENDYEMLLALDDNNHQHVGANSRQINGLPESTVQSENFAEDCAVCLETPTIGDTIRHLPCLHKFHKECIDPWLKRKTSCPICKSGIT